MTMTREAPRDDLEVAAGRITLAVVLLGAVIGPMLMSGTTVALPDIGADLDASGGPLQWVVTGYFLSAACFMLIAGSLADLLGRRRVLRAGALVYVAGTASVAAAPNIWIVDVARTVSGVGAAGIMAAGGALLAATFDGPARTRAFAAVGTAAGVGLAVGPTAAGILIGGLGWRATFSVFAILGSVILVGTFFVTESRSDADVRIDWRGAVTFIAGLGLVMLAITQLPGAASISPMLLVQFAAGAALLLAFVLIEKRVAHPLLDLDLLRDRQFAAWCLACASLALGSTAVLVTLPTYLQGVNGVSPGRAGAVMLMLTVPIIAVPSLGARLVNGGASPRLVITAALAAMALGNAWLLVLHPGISAAGLLGPLVTIGVGAGLAIGIVDARAMALVPPDRVGMASGLLNTVRGGSNAVLLALVGAVMVGLLRVSLGDDALAQRVSSGDLRGPDPALLADHLTTVWRITLVGIAALCAASAVAVALLLRSVPSRSAAEN
ncbi:MFS transporter [Rhodococcus daqingensis]|uniref:MFS transporter n=1 Tax=Rhodococcus daqingensis TaxID=2479363 RepID=A0ABW2S1K6_9NOCA